MHIEINCCGGTLGLAVVHIMPLKQLGILSKYLLNKKSIVSVKDNRGSFIILIKKSRDLRQS